MFAGFFGMRASTKGNSRTAWAANQGGMGKALIVSYLSG
jgi:Na+/H+-translocating membrane pyrophosphatase